VVNKKETSKCQRTTESVVITKYYVYVSYETERFAVFILTQKSDVYFITYEYISNGVRCKIIGLRIKVFVRTVLPKNPLLNEALYTSVCLAYVYK
jgi:hypothetical protein